jgi:hypothetical protein
MNAENCDQNDLNQQNVKHVAEYLLRLEILRSPDTWTTANQSTVDSRRIFIQDELSRINVDQYYADYLANRTESGKFARQEKNKKVQQINPKYLKEWDAITTMLDHHCETYERAIGWNEADTREGRKEDECRLCMYPIHTYKRTILGCLFTLNQLEKCEDFIVSSAPILDK